MSGNGNSFAFEEVRPLCIEVSKHAFQNSDRFDANSVGLTNSLKELNDKLQCLESPLSQQFADYVFMPIGSLLKQPSLSLLQTEYVLLIITNLLRLSWAENGSLDYNLAKQLFPILTFLISKDTENKSLEGMSDHYRLVSAKTLFQFFQSLSNQRNYCNNFYSVTNKETLPSLGHSITILLDILQQLDGDADVQIVSLNALSILFKDIIADGEILSFVLPGSVSAFAKVLARSGVQTNYKVIVLALQVLGNLLCLIYDDFSLKVEKTNNISLENITELIGNDLTITSENKSELNAIMISDDQLARKEVHRNTSWLLATSTQTKRALKSFVPKLLKRNNDRINKELEYFASQLLLNCKLSLSSCAFELISLLMELQSTQLRTLGLDYELLFNILESKAAKINEIIKFENVHELQSLAYGFEVLNGINFSHSLILKTLQALNNVLIDDVEQYSIKKKSTKIVEQRSDLVISNLSFDNVSMSDTSILSNIPKDVEQNIALFLSRLGVILQKNRMLDEEVNDILSQYSDSSITSRIISLWISTNVVSCLGSDYGSSENDLYLDFSNASNDQEIPESYYTILEESRELATMINVQIESNGLTKQSVQAMCVALNAIAVVSTLMKDEFENELIDYLYIVIDSLASSSPEIRERAKVCATILANNLYAGSVKDLIVNNVDYLVESISVRLNSGMTQRVSTILMVISNLAGYEIIMSFTDIIETIFKLLDYYHGYSDLCVQFFQFFEVIILEMRKTYLSPNNELNKLGNLHLVQGGYAPWGMKNVDQILYILDKKDDEFDEPEFDESTEPKNFQEYFDSKLRKVDSDDDMEEDCEERVDEEIESTDVENNGQNESEKWVSPIPRVSYRILLKILSYCDRLLTHPSKPLKVQIFSVIKLIIPMIATQHESLLPQVAKLWDILVENVLQSDFSIVKPACECITIIIKYSEDFIAKRFIDLWETLKTKSHILTKLYQNQSSSANKSTKVNEHPSIEVILHQKFPAITKLALIRLAEMLLEGVSIAEMIIPDTMLEEMIYCCIQVVPVQLISTKSIVLGDTVWAIINAH